MPKGKIQIEKESKERFMLHLMSVNFDGKIYQIPKLTKRNIALNEAYINNDSDYITQDTDVPGTSAYYFLKLKEQLKLKSVNRSKYREIIYGAVTTVDKENSTHLNADKVGWDVITERICLIKRPLLIKYLKYPKETDYKLFRIIAERTHESKGGRVNPSFASKFCHYACIYMFPNTKFEDNYSIWDSIVRKGIPYYAKYYRVAYPKRLIYKTAEDYIIYQEVIDEIIRKSRSGISRYAFDHLLWYYFKARTFQFD